MISLITQPGDNQLSGDPAVWRWRLTDADGNPYRAYGARAKLTATGDITLAENDEFILEWTEPNGASQSVTFTAVTSPLNENQVQAGLGGAGTYLKYYQGLAESIENHHSVGGLFKCYAVANGADYELYVESRKIEPDWIVSFEITGVTNVNFSEASESLTADNTPAGYHLLYQVHFADLEGAYVKLFQGEPRPDVSGEVYADLRQALRSYVENKIGTSLLPDLTATEPESIEMARRYFIRYKENENNNSNSWTESNIKTVFPGRRDVIDYPDTHNYLASKNANDAFLPVAVQGNVVGSSQSTWLHWYNHTGGSADIVLQVTALTSTGTSTPSYVYTSNPLSVPDNQVARIPVNYGQLNLVNALGYEVQVVDASSDYTGGSPTFLSESVLFYVDRITHRQELEFVFLNEFYLPESFRCLGDLTVTQEIERGLVRRFLAHDYTREDTEFDDYSSDNVILYTFRTAPMPKKQLLRLQALFAYNALYLRDGNDLLRYIINSDSFTLQPGGEFLYQAQFEAVRSIRSLEVENIIS